MLALNVGRKRRSLVEVISEWWRACSSSVVTLSELVCCAEGEVERLAKDMGLSAAELRKLSRLDPDAANLVLQRMAALDLDQNAVSQTEPKIFQDLQHVCTLCKFRKTCARDLEYSPTDKSWEVYCPNAVTLRVLKAMRRVPQHAW